MVAIEITIFGTGKPSVYEERSHFSPQWNLWTWGSGSVLKESQSLQSNLPKMGSWHLTSQRIHHDSPKWRAANRKEGYTRGPYLGSTVKIWRCLWNAKSLQYNIVGKGLGSRISQPWLQILALPLKDCATYLPIVRFHSVSSGPIS